MQVARSSLTLFGMQLAKLLLLARCSEQSAVDNRAVCILKMPLCLNQAWPLVIGWLERDK
jgi:hypothetical protein